MIKKTLIIGGTDHDTAELIKEKLSTDICVKAPGHIGMLDIVLERNSFNKIVMLESWGGPLKILYYVLHNISEQEAADLMFADLGKITPVITPMVEYLLKEKPTLDWIENLHERQKQLSHINNIIYSYHGGVGRRRS